MLHFFNWKKIFIYFLNSLINQKCFGLHTTWVRTIIKLSMGTSFRCKVSHLKVNLWFIYQAEPSCELESANRRKLEMGRKKKKWVELTSETSNWQISWKSCKLEWENWTLLAQRQGKWNNGSKACTIKTQVKNKVKNRHKWEPEKLSYIIRVLDINLGCIKVFFFFFSAVNQTTENEDQKVKSQWHSFVPYSIF